jgi:predicted AAA+ superfamily ATPase
MKMFKRLLSFELPRKQSAFLWGARQTGKSTFLRKHFPGSAYFDFLNTEMFARYVRRPNEFREAVMLLPEAARALPIIVDEVQKVPPVLDEVHWLIENQGMSFVLCGSSARKLKRGGANLLGGRAWHFEFYPLVYPEIPEFDLLRALNNGLLPRHYDMKNATRSLNAYVDGYLKEEIQAEGLVRNLPAFARFLDSMGFRAPLLILGDTD